MKRLISMMLGAAGLLAIGGCAVGKYDYEMGREPDCIFYGGDSK